MLKNINFQEFFLHFRQAVLIMKETMPFIRENQLWTGLFENKWVTAFVLFIASLFTYHVFRDIGQIFSIVNDPEMLQSGLIVGMDNISDTISKQSQHAISAGGSKYLLILFLEIILYAFTVKTISILTNQNIDLELKDFVEAEKRMLIVMLRNFIKTIVSQVFIYIVLSIVGLVELVPFFMFFVYAYFMGYAFLDNYMEQFSKTIKSSQTIIQHHVGASTALGLAASLLLYIPIAGPILVPILGAVAATLYGHRYHLEKHK